MAKITDSLNPQRAYALKFKSAAAWYPLVQYLITQGEFPESLSNLLFFRRKTNIRGEINVSCFLFIYFFKLFYFYFLKNCYIVHLLPFPVKWKNKKLYFVPVHMI